MPEETREALERALMDLLTGYTAVANRAVFLDALDARVRALATGADAAPRARTGGEEMKEESDGERDVEPGGALPPVSLRAMQGPTGAQRVATEVDPAAVAAMAAAQSAPSVAVALPSPERDEPTEVWVNLYEFDGGGAWLTEALALKARDADTGARTIHCVPASRHTRELAEVRGSYERAAAAWDETGRVLNARRAALTAEVSRLTRENAAIVAANTAVHESLTAAERVAEERRERAKQAEADVATLAAERERYFGRIAELEGALRNIRVEASSVGMRTTIVNLVDAALTPSAAKPEEPRCTECGHVARFHVAGHECAGDSYTGGKTCRCDTFAAPPPAPAAKGDGAKCGTCGDEGFVDVGGLGSGMRPCPSCAAPAAGEQWGIYRTHGVGNPWVQVGTEDEATAKAKAESWNKGTAYRYEARHLPPAAKGEK